MKRFDRLFRHRFRFFHGMNGCVGRAALAAWELARAEEEASRRGWTVTWESDPFCDGGPRDWGWDENSKQVRDWDRTDHACYVAVLRDEQGTSLEALGGIWDPTLEYERLVNAELASEALAREKQERARTATATLWQP